MPPLGFNSAPGLLRHEIFLGGSRGPVMHSRHQLQFEVKIVSGVFLAAILGVIVLWFVSK